MLAVQRPAQNSAVSCFLCVLENGKVRPSEALSLAADCLVSFLHEPSCIIWGGNRMQLWVDFKIPPKFSQLELFIAVILKNDALLFPYRWSLKLWLSCIFKKLFLI